MNTPFTREEKNSIYDKLEIYHKAFYTFYEFSGCYWSDTVPYAAVGFNKSANTINLYFNKTY